jgi:hypothetical protein
MKRNSTFGPSDSSPHRPKRNSQYVNSSVTFFHIKCHKNFSKVSGVEGRKKSDWLSGRQIEPFGDRRDCFLFICGPSWRSWVSKVGNIEWKGKGGRFENFARRFAERARTLSSKTSTRPGNYQWLPVRPRGGLRQDSCSYFVYIQLFFIRGLFVCYWCARPPWRPWGRGG